MPVYARRRQRRPPHTTRRRPQPKTTRRCVLKELSCVVIVVRRCQCVGNVVTPTLTFRHSAFGVRRRTVRYPAIARSKDVHGKGRRVGVGRSTLCAALCGAALHCALCGVWGCEGDEWWWVVMRMGCMHASERDITQLIDNCIKTHTHYKIADQDAVCVKSVRNPLVPCTERCVHRAGGRRGRQINDGDHHSSECA